MEIIKDSRAAEEAELSKIVEKPVSLQGNRLFIFIFI
jgi:hypothetical protein